MSAIFLKTIRTKKKRSQEKKNAGKKNKTIKNQYNNKCYGVYRNTTNRFSGSYHYCRHYL